MSEVADSTEARSQSLLSTATQDEEEAYVSDSVANIGESGDRDRCLGTSVAYLGVKCKRLLAPESTPLPLHSPE